MSQESQSDSTPVAQLVEELGAGAQLVDEGEFTLDPIRAREKLHTYQLADPNGYLLLLVEAACLAAPGERKPEVRFTLGRTLVCEFLSLELSEVELQQLLGGVFRKLEGLEGEALARARTLRLLGLALNAALTLPIEHATVEFVEPNGQSHGARFMPSGDCEPIAFTHASASRGRVCFRLRFSALENLSMRDERELLEQRCCYAPFLVEVGGERIDQGMGAGLDYGGATPHAESTIVPVRLEGEQIGIASKRTPDRPALLLLVTRGVLSTPIELEGMYPGFRALVYADLRKDLAQAKVVRDERYEALLGAVADVHDQLPDIELARPWELSAQASDQQGNQWYVLIALLTVVFVALALWLMVRRERPPSLERVFDSPRADALDPRAQLSCEPDEPKACIERAQYGLELGTPESVAEARSLLDTACEVEREACRMLRTLKEGPFVIGQRWRGSLNCDGVQLPAVLDVAKDTTMEGLLRYRLDGVMYVVWVSLNTERGRLSTQRRRWVAPPSMRKEGGGQPNLEGRFASPTRISGKITNQNCSTFALELESGALPDLDPSRNRP